MSYRPTFAVHAIGRDEPKALEIGIEAMGFLTKALTLIDESHLRRFPTTTPRLYSEDFNALYDPMDPPEGSACGDDDWADLGTILDDESPKGPNGEKLLDCFPVGTLLLRDDYELIPIEEIKVGDRIWGRDAWTTVEIVEYKGILSVDGLMMNNGSIVQLTGDHHVFIGRCDQHTGIKDEYGCSCPVDERRIERTPLRDVKKHDVLLSPNEIPFGKRSESVDRAYIEGLYVSDGWSCECENFRFQISGKDGKRKEKQKHDVKAFCDKLGIHTYWNDKYISVHDKEWTLRVHGMGMRAPEKHVLSLDLDEATAEATLRGVMADSSPNASRGWTFYSTSKTLTIQVRLLHKMFGRSSSVIYIDGPRKGSFGKLPIWYLGIRDPKTKNQKLLRVKSLLPDLAELPCYDIQTSDHYVYLPEHDVTVSNCEDAASIRAAEANVIFRVGETAKPITCPCCTGRGWVFPRVEPYVMLHRDWVRDERGERRRRHLYHVVDRWPEGLPRYPNTVERVDGILLEDPSDVLGMGR